MRHTLSIVVITKNEENMIQGCLESVKWADEIIIADAESSDKTVARARRFTKKVFIESWRGFASQKNFGISKATSEWILIVDADERVSVTLRQEIQDILLKPTSIVAYDIPFRNFFLGKEMKHGGWQHETHIRLFRKSKARYNEQQIHEFLEINGQVGKLNNAMLHFSHRDIQSNLLKTRQYAILESKYAVERGHPPVTRKTLARNIFDHFWYRFVKEQGYKDGMEGFIEATYQAFSQIFIIQSMIWERQRGKSVDELYEELDRKIQKGKLL